MTPAQQIVALLATMPIREQLALLRDEAQRVAEHYAVRAVLRAKAGRGIPLPVRDDLAALERAVDSAERLAGERLGADSARVGVTAIVERAGGSAP